MNRLLHILSVQAFEGLITANYERQSFRFPLRKPMPEQSGGRRSSVRPLTERVSSLVSLTAGKGFILPLNRLAPVGITPTPLRRIKRRINGLRRTAGGIQPACLKRLHATHGNRFTTESNTGSYTRVRVTGFRLVKVRLEAIKTTLGSSQVNDDSRADSETLNRVYCLCWLNPVNERSKTVPVQY